MNFAHRVKAVLYDKIHEMAQYPWLFSTNPNSDFSRKRKIDFQTLIQILINMEAGSVKKELLEFFHYDLETPTTSAFNQQRSKLLPEAMQFLFEEFSKEFDDFSTYQGYRLIACDGSDLSIARNPEDKQTYFQTSPTSKGYNLLYLNAFYDLCSKRYLDAVIEPRQEYNEYRACISMMKRSSIDAPRILIADRGYENYNLIAHASAEGWNYLIRIKDRNSSGIASGLQLPTEDTFDVDISLLMTRRYTNEIKAHPEIYKFLPKKAIFDFLEHGEKGTYPIRFRVVRFRLTDGTYEMLITNLDRENFPVEKLKELYGRRWGIETSFRELKYAVGLTSFHSKKVVYIQQEIYTRLLLYNFCEIITMHVVVEQKDTKHCYQINYTIAIHICRYFLKCLPDIRPPDVEALIRKNLLPVRDGRHDPRKVRNRSAVSFLYRVA